jgi:aminopeptidase N
MTRFLIVCIILFYPILSFSQTLAPYAVPGEKSDLCQHVYPLKSADAEPYNPLLDHYDITFTKLDFESTNSSDYIRGYAYIEAKVTAAQLGTFCIQLAQAMRIDSIQFNGLTTAYTHTNDEILIQLSSPLAENTAFKVLIYYRGYGNDDTDYAGGLHHVSSSSKFNYEPLTYSFTQPFGASLWFPCKQLLNDKIDSLHIFVTTHASDKVSANGLLTRVVDLPSNKKRYEWKTRYPVAYYLVAFNVFNYTEYSFYTHPEGFTDSIFIQNFMVDQNHVNAMKNEIDKVNGAMSL